MVIVTSAGRVGPRRAAPPVAAPLRILFVDNQVLCAHALARLLRDAGTKCLPEYCIDPREALELLAVEHFDLVVCNVKAGPLTPFDLIREIAQRGWAVPVIMVAAPGEESLLLDGFHAGGAAIFETTASEEDFLAGVEAVVQGHRAVDRHLIEKVLRSRSHHAAERELRPVGKLSATERDILRLIGEAVPIPRIAAARGITTKTVRNHVASIYGKLNVHNRTEAMLIATRLGLSSAWLD